MERRNGFWVAAAVLFALANAVAAGFYYARGEVPHSLAHASLMVLGTWLVWWLNEPAAPRDRASLPPGDERLERLQQSMDAVALEVERIGEAQRFSAKVESQRGERER
jgi:hypothetical protein